MLNVNTLHVVMTHMQISLLMYIVMWSLYVLPCSDITIYNVCTYEIITDVITAYANTITEALILLLSSLLTSVWK